MSSHCGWIQLNIACAQAKNPACVFLSLKAFWSSWSISTNAMAYAINREHVFHRFFMVLGAAFVLLTKYSSMQCSGKSTVGKLVADALDYPLLDSDEVAEEFAECSIAEIFSNEGEESFRELETKVLQVSCFCYSIKTPVWASSECTCHLHAVFRALCKAIVYCPDMTSNKSSARTGLNLGMKRI